MIEALGVLDRARVADDVKGLEQPARASLRKYGVRFGAYHIYLPALLKPAPRALATQLWALRHDGADSKVLDQLLHLASSGRTSIPADPTIDPAFYRTAGYRVCGARAVRVDILERLADLIRPALAWREGAAGARPLGAVLGGGFTVVNTMTSLIGASGEDFASILRSLGYRMERRPKPSEPPPAAAQPPTDTVASVPPPEAELDAALGLSHEAAVPAHSANAPPDLANAPLAPDLSASAQETPAGFGSSESNLQSAAEPAEAAQEPASQEPASTVAQTIATDRGEAALPTEQGMPAEQEMIEVWRPGRTEGRRRAHARPHGRAKQARIKPSVVAPEPAQDGNATQTQTTALPAPTDLASEGAHARQQQRFRQRRKPEHRIDRQQRERPPVKRFERREKMPDPNSPFAKLASLKAQLEADAKERR